MNQLMHRSQSKSGYLLPPAGLISPISSNCFERSVSIVRITRSSRTSSLSLHPSILFNKFTYNNPSTATSAPAPAPNIGKAVAAAPEASSPPVLASPPAAALVAESPADPALPVTDPADCEALPAASVGVASAAKTVVRVKVRVSSWSSGSSSKSVDVVVKTLVIIEPEAEEVIVPLLVLPVAVAAALKVVEVKPQELITSSTSVVSTVNQSRQQL